MRRLEPLRNARGYTSYWLQEPNCYQRSSGSPVTNSGCDVSWQLGGPLCFWDSRPMDAGMFHTYSEDNAAVSSERQRVREAGQRRSAWRRWGPYLSERQCGTVREDYSPDGTAWDYFPHGHARSGSYRWGEDGLAGISDDNQFLCLSLVPQFPDPVNRVARFARAVPATMMEILSRPLPAGHNRKDRWFPWTTIPMRRAHLQPVNSRQMPFARR